MTDVGAETHTCSKCDKPKHFSEFHQDRQCGWLDTTGVKRHHRCKSCGSIESIPHHAKLNPKDNAVSREMHQRMVDLDIPRTEHYADEHTTLRKQLRKEINADGSWQKDGKVPEPNKEAAPPKPKKIKKVRLPKWVDNKVGRHLDATGTCADLRDNLEITQGVCELTGVCFESCDTSHLTSQKQCKDLNRSDLIAEPDNAVLLDMRINRAMEPKYGFTFTESGQLVPPPGGEYYPWMAEAGIPDARIEVTEGCLVFIRMAAMERARWEDLA